MKNLILLVFSICFLVFSTAPLIKDIKMNKEKTQVCSEEVSMAFYTPSNEMDLVGLALTPIAYERQVLSDMENPIVHSLYGFPVVNEKPPIQVSEKAIILEVLNVDVNFTLENYKKADLNEKFDYSCSNKLLRQAYSL